MKRLFICVTIAALSITGIYAQEIQTQQQQEQDLRDYKQKLDRELQETIRSQTQSYKMEAEKRMQTRKREVQNDLESRRTQLMHRPEGMASYRGN